MLSHVIWHSIIDEGADEVIQALIALPFEEFAFENVVPADYKSPVSCGKLEDQNKYIRFNQHICVSKLKYIPLCALLS